MKEMKTCIICGEDKPRNADHFHYRNKGRGWFSSWCKPCRATKRAETASRELALQRIRRNSKKRECRTCGVVEPERGHVYCKDCLAARRREAKRRDKCLYRSRLRKATPKWADRSAIRRFYDECPYGMVVDHVIPIRGRTVSGFHIVENLQYLTPKENMKKSNHWKHP